MHNRIIRALATVGAVGALAALPVSAGAATAHATTKKVSFQLHTHITNRSTSGTHNGHGVVNGSLSGTFTAAVAPPLTKYVLTVPGGKIDITALFNIKGTQLSGTWHATGGTGRYHDVKGTGTASGALAVDAVFRFSGTLHY